MKKLVVASLCGWEQPRAHNKKLPLYFLQTLSMILIRVFSRDVLNVCCNQLCRDTVLGGEEE